CISIDIFNHFLYSRLDFIFFFEVKKSIMSQVVTHSLSHLQPQAAPDLSQRESCLRSTCFKITLLIASLLIFAGFTVFSGADLLMLHLLPSYITATVGLSGAILGALGAILAIVLLAKQNGKIPNSSDANLLTKEKPQENVAEEIDPKETLDL